MFVIKSTFHAVHMHQVAATSRKFTCCTASVQNFHCLPIMSQRQDRDRKPMWVLGVAALFNFLSGLFVYDKTRSFLLRATLWDCYLCLDSRNVVLHHTSWHQPCTDVTSATSTTSNTVLRGVGQADYLSNVAQGLCQQLMQLFKYLLNCPLNFFNYLSQILFSAKQYL